MNGARHLRWRILVTGIFCSGITLQATLSPERAAQISGVLREKLPKYSDRPAAKPAPAAETEELPDGTLILPAMKIRQQAFPPEAVRLTDTARIARAMKAHPGLKIGNFGRQSDVAELMQREDTLALHQRETSAIVNNATLDPNTPEARKIRELLGASVQQPSQYWQNDRGSGRP